jgi:hypothetical protein
VSIGDMVVCHGLGKDVLTGCPHLVTMCSFVSNVVKYAAAPRFLEVAAAGHEGSELLSVPLVNNVISLPIFGCSNESRPVPKPRYVSVVASVHDQILLLQAYPNGPDPSGMMAPPNGMYSMAGEPPAKRLTREDTQQHQMQVHQHQLQLQQQQQQLQMQQQQQLHQSESITQDQKEKIIKVCLPPPSPPQNQKKKRTKQRSFKTDHHSTSCVRRLRVEVIWRRCLCERDEERQRGGGREETEREARDFYGIISPSVAFSELRCKAIM